MEEKKGFSINWVETGKLFLSALVIFTKIFRFKVFEFYV